MSVVLLWNGCLLVFDLDLIWCFVGGWQLVCGRDLFGFGLFRIVVCV